MYSEGYQFARNTQWNQFEVKEYEPSLEALETQRGSTIFEQLKKLGFESIQEVQNLTEKQFFNKIKHLKSHNLLEITMTWDENSPFVKDYLEINTRRGVYKKVSSYLKSGTPYQWEYQIIDPVGMVLQDTKELLYACGLKFKHSKTTEPPGMLIDITYLDIPPAIKRNFIIRGKFNNLKELDDLINSVEDIFKLDNFNRRKLLGIGFKDKTLELLVALIKSQKKLISEA